MTTDREFAQQLQVTLTEFLYAAADDLENAGESFTDFAAMLAEDVNSGSNSSGSGGSIESFNEAGVMTMNEGLVIRCADGSAFQLTIVECR